MALHSNIYEHFELDVQKHDLRGRLHSRTEYLWHQAQGGLSLYKTIDARLLDCIYSVVAAAHTLGHEHREKSSAQNCVPLSAARRRGPRWFRDDSMTHFAEKREAAKLQYSPYNSK